MLMLFVPYIFEVALHIMPNYGTNTLVNDLFSCFLYFPCFLIGYWMAENRVLEWSSKVRLLRNPIICILSVFLIFAARILVHSVGGFLLDVFYAPMLICILVNLSETFDYKPISVTLNCLGKYSTGIWFFHAVFFSTYISNWFKPMLQLISNPFLMFIWLVLLSLVGAFVYMKILDALRMLALFVKRSC